ncbi:MAG: dihydroorotase [Flavobacteriales bacterium]|nr:dihydroorotase [Flavobacteriales bacterium]
MKPILIKNALLINEEASFTADVLIKDSKIERIERSGINDHSYHIMDAAGLWLIPGVIDDQVHFREPGLTHKAEIATESMAAVAGGTTTFMEMPNTIPAAVSQELLQNKYDIAAACSPANYSFFMGTTNNNLDEVLKTDPLNVCGVKIFMGSSTGNMLVDDPGVLENLFSKCELLIATHCEDEETIRKNLAFYTSKYGENMGAEQHPEIRSREACLKSSKFAVELARKHNTRLHILHISTAEETDLFDSGIDLHKKRITSEVCVHHLSFDSGDYPRLGNKIKCNPAIKTRNDQDALWRALLDNKLDIIATDHAPHTLDEKSSSYLKAPAGLPLVQHSLMRMLEHVQNGKISKETMVRKMCHAPADCFRVSKRGYLREGYYADLVLIDPKKNYTVSRENILFKCGWSPFEGETWNASVHSTYVNGELVFDGKKVLLKNSGMRLKFDR